MSQINPPADPTISELKGRPIGRVLLKMGKVTREQIAQALQLQKRQYGVLIGRLLIDLGYVMESDVSIGLAAQEGYTPVAIRKIFGERPSLVPRKYHGVHESFWGDPANDSFHN